MMKVQVRFFSGLLLCAALLLTSCNGEINDIHASGGKVLVSFRLSGNSYAGATSPVRGSYPDESRTVVLPVPGSDMYLSATLAASPAAPVRATRNLAPGTRLWIGAYDGGSLAGWETYTVDSNGNLTADNSGLEIQAGSYTFVAYSYNSTSRLPAYQPVISGINPAADLMWGSSAATVGAGSSAVSLTLSHKFSQLSVVISTDNYTTRPLIAKISNVSVTPACWASLDVATGTLSPGNAAVRYIDNSWSGINTTTVTSAPATVYTGVMGVGDSVVVHIDSMKIGNTVYSGSTAFAPAFKMNLDPGKSYTLTVNMKYRVKFAASNIYWDGNKLTFDPYTPSPSMTSMQKQGILFKWGSLVGISASGKAGQQSQSWSDTVSIYVPTSATSWTRMTVADAVSQGKWSVGGYEGIPHAQGDDCGTDGRDDTYLTTGAVKDSTAWFKGDICQYIDNSYRMPTSNDFGFQRDYDPTRLPPSTLYTVETDIGGQALIPEANGVVYTAANKMFFPASGVRNVNAQLATNGQLVRVGIIGYYWCSSANAHSSDLKGYSESFTYNGVNSITQAPGFGYSVRCVRK